LRLKILKKLRTASLNSEFTGSYIKKSVASTQNLLVLMYKKLQIMMSYIMHDILKPSAFWKIWQRKISKKSAL